ncbi:hypothetical protein DOTSEDRAFT_75754 [Dothistroma septosporum NZE10]|uniref:DNA2/NAM7 helicase-like C-terminal domain-containing protein n=1 Tax=Dothistroma septosporum (strain NZE10 / CBS 128990) TaxID=675120 RepID=N1PDL6_DOTSN|nr:hypothetical protein DOTSEDRAFT_75754 [Dothistroma septosporum NZE10]
MSEEVMIICAYAHAKRLYQNRISHERKKNSALTNDDMPPLETVDGSQGKQSFMVILDGTFQKGDYLGFMTDPLRANVAITRAQEICWIIGGAMICSEPASEKQIIVQYKREMESAGRCHRFN